MIKYSNIIVKLNKLQMQLSAKKQRDMTYLEIQAQQIVNEDEDAPEVNDEQKYEAILAKRQERRTVIYISCFRTFL